MCRREEPPLRQPGGTTRLYPNRRTRYNLTVVGRFGKTMETIESINLITRKPDVRGGRPCIKGTGLRVTDIVVAMRYHGRTPDQIAEGFQVSLAGVYAALAYYHLHVDEIDADIEDQIQTARRLQREHFENGGLSLLDRKASE